LAKPGFLLETTGILRLGYQQMLFFGLSQKNSIFVLCYDLTPWLSPQLSLQRICDAGGAMPATAKQGRSDED
jgi:hypothetical protein